MSKIRSLFSSKVFLMAFLGAIASSAVVTKDALDSNTIGKSYVLEMVAIWTSAAVTISARIEDAGEVYTPKWLPGPNKEDAESKEKDGCQTMN